MYILYFFKSSVYRIPTNLNILIKFWFLVLVKKKKQKALMCFNDHNTKLLQKKLMILSSIQMNLYIILFGYKQ